MLQSLARSLKGLNHSDGPLLAQGAVNIFAVRLVCP